MSAGHRTMSEQDACLKSQQPNRSFSFDVGPEVVSLGSRKAVAEICDGASDTEVGKAGNDVEVDGPPRTFDDILERMGKGRRVPTTLRE
jgi:hypothetical protein